MKIALIVYPLNMPGEARKDVVEKAFRRLTPRGYEPSFFAMPEATDAYFFCRGWQNDKTCKMLHEEALRSGKTMMFEEDEPHE